MDDPVIKAMTEMARETEKVPDLVARGLVKTYGDRTVVNGMSMEVRCGEIVGLLGPNGAGKTTTFYMIVGLVKPNEGSVTFRGEDVTHLPVFMRARKGLGYLAQEASVFRKLSVWDNVMAILETLKMKRADRAARCEELLASLDLMKVAKQPAYTLSGGERRKLEIARALVRRPSILMLDEPFAGVDPLAVHDIQEIVRSLRTRVSASSSRTTTCARRSTWWTAPTWCTTAACSARARASTSSTTRTPVGSTSARISECNENQPTRRIQT